MENNDCPRFMEMRILEWMACSYRTLKIYEILDAIAFRPEYTAPDLRMKMRREVLDQCQPLIEYGHSNTVDFVHFSAKEYATPSQTYTAIVLTFHRYILEECYRSSTPFINRMNAALNISFSCIAYLNISLNLLPTHSKPHDRALALISGFHGLQIYANKFWVDHLRSYCVLLAETQKPPSNELLNQLDRLTRFKKPSSGPATPQDMTLLSEFGVLGHRPHIMMLLAQLLNFRTQQEHNLTSNLQEKAPQGMFR
jgi:hypothetical protein